VARRVTGKIACSTCGEWFIGEPLAVFCSECADYYLARLPVHLSRERETNMKRLLITLLLCSAPSLAMADNEKHLLADDGKTLWVIRDDGTFKVYEIVDNQALEITVIREIVKGCSLQEEHSFKTSFMGWLMNNSSASDAETEANSERIREVTKREEEVCHEFFQEAIRRHQESLKKQVPWWSFSWWRP